MKVVYKALSLHLFYITVADLCENDIGMRLCKLTFTIISSYLVCILFGIPSLHLFTILMFFKSCFRLYGHCMHLGVNKLGGSGGHAPPGKFLK